jgi:hypothetical protein
MKAFVFVGRKRPEDEWNGVLASLGIEFCRFRDPESCWYQQDYWSQQIQDAINQHGHPDLSFGSSMGGWAALYFQPLIKAKCVLAFTPQATTIPDEMIAMGGKKNTNWGTSLKNMEYKGTRLPAPDGKAILYYGTESKATADSKHRKVAESLGYKTEIINSTDHNLAGWLHTQGLLLDILKNGLN